MRASAQDVEWLLVGLTEFQECLIRAKYQQDAKARNRVWAIWFVGLIDKRRPNDGRGTIDRLSRATLDYWMDPKICKVCEGVGETMAENLVITCEPCQGTGRKERSASAICRSLGLPKGHVYPEWIARWNDALAELDREEAIAARQMIRRIKAD